MEYTVIIPARHASTRLPGKPLLEIAGKPMIAHVYQRAVESGANRVVVATDDERIASAVTDFGGEVCMTAETHLSGTERLAEAVEKLDLPDDAIVVNLQGDEPLIPAELLSQVATNLAEHPAAVMATLATPIATSGELFDPHVVKVVTDSEGYAIYFSRAVIPWDRDAFAVTTEELPDNIEHLRHLGIYAYRAAFIKEYVCLAPCTLEMMESLEQLRVLWHGEKIHVAEAKRQPGPGVDTADDLAEVARILSAQG